MRRLRSAAKTRLDFFAPCVGRCRRPCVCRSTAVQLNAPAAARGAAIVLRWHRARHDAPAATRGRLPGHLKAGCRNRRTARRLGGLKFFQRTTKANCVNVQQQLLFNVPKGISRPFNQARTNANGQAQEKIQRKFCERSSNPKLEGKRPALVGRYLCAFTSGARHPCNESTLT
jgi:hypothetical protein